MLVTVPNEHSLQEKVSTFWSENELEEILDPTDNVIISDEKIQRDALMQAVKTQTEDTEHLRSMMSAVVGWDNKEPAIALWGGHIEKANELRTQSDDLSSPESVETALIERFSQPVYQERDFTKTQLAEKLLPVVRSSPISQLRPGIWERDERAIERIHQILDEYVDEMYWDE
jgi:hypothetical protein